LLFLNITFFSVCISKDSDTLTVCSLMSDGECVGVDDTVVFREGGYATITRLRDAESTTTTTN
jgi:hypothetical protein